MNVEKQALEPDRASRYEGEESRAAFLGRIPFRGADARRSVNNILRWNTYLPSECVRTMVRMGWDYST